MRHFTEDCVFAAPRRPDPGGRRGEGADAVRRGLAARLEGIPDVSRERTDCDLVTAPRVIDAL